MKKRIFAAFLAAAMIVTAAVSVSAEYDPNKLISPNVVSTKMLVPQFKINVNNEDMEAPAPFENEEGTLMIPLRALTEKLGFEVQWIGETGTIILVKGPVYITMSAFEDGYTFSKTAPMLLGTKPILIDGVTFIPVNFVEEILKGSYKIEMDGTIKIYDEENSNIALIDEINADEKQITVTDITKGKVILNISNETLVTDEEGKAVKFEELLVGNTLKVTYSEAMTKSIPPMNTPQVIVVKSSSPAMTLPSDELVETEEEAVAVITAVDVKEGTITVNDSVRGEVVLVVSEETKLLSANGEEIKIEDIKPEIKAEIVYGEAMTMSLPPINNPVSVKLK